MLTGLTLQNLALFENLEVSLQPGFTVITGETGAGKSLLLDGLGLALGNRAEASLIRPNQTTAEATATFHLPQTPELAQFLESQGLETSDSTATLTFRRQLKRDGAGATSKAWLNGTPMPISVLAQAADLVLDLHSQHATMALFSPSAQTDLLDSLAGATTQAQAVKTAHTATQQAKQALTQLQAAATHQEAMATLTTEWLKDLNKLNYQQGEETDLTTRRAKVAHHGQLLTTLTTADQALESTLGPLQTAQRSLSGASRIDESLTGLSTRLQTLLTEAQDVAYDLARAMPTEPEDSLEAIDDRLHALRAAARRHKVDISDLPQVLTDLQNQAAAAQTLTQQLADAETALHKAQTALQTAANVLTKERQRRSKELQRPLQTALQNLHLPHAQLEIRLTPQPEITSQGAEKVEIYFTANPGQPLAPLSKTASGGELSRAMLAIKSILFHGLSPRTVVLDEVDTGTSGPTATAIGAAMALIAQQHQVLTVTHHPQVAAHAAHHFFLTKSVTDGQTTTHLIPLNAEQRITELARLLAGANVTPQARAAAQALLTEAQTQSSQAA